MFKDKTAIIFDFDGTIADTFKLHERAFREALKAYPLKFDYSNFTGMSTRDAIKDIFLQNGVLMDDTAFPELVSHKQALANKLYNESISFMPGALSFINMVYNKGFLLAVGSSGSRKNIAAGLQALRIQHLFKTIITSDDVSKGKPDPEIFNNALDQLGVSKQQALVVEDAVSGIAAANAAGIDVVCVNREVTINENPAIFYTAMEFSELIKLLEDDSK